MKAALKKYVKERDEMLKKCDVNELRKFIETHREYFSKRFLEKLSFASNEVLEVTLHKMIVNVITLPEPLRIKSALWLAFQGYDAHIKN